MIYWPSLPCIRTQWSSWWTLASDREQEVLNLPQHPGIHARSQETRDFVIWDWSARGLGCREDIVEVIERELFQSRLIKGFGKIAPI